MKNNKIMKSYITNNLLSTAEVCKALSISRPTLNALIKKEKITPIKNISNVQLFFKPDVDELINSSYKDRIIRNIEQNNIFYIQCRPRQVTNDIMKAIPYFQFQEIINIKLFYSRIDSILNGYYSIFSYSNDELLPLESPHGVITLLSGEELWINGFSCGYNGSSTRATQSFLKKLSIPEEDIQKLFYSDIIEYYTYNDSWTTEIIKKHKTQEENITDEIYLFNNNLVLLQYDWYYYPIDYIDNFLITAKKFLSKPIAVTIFSYSKALETGHYRISTSGNVAYQIVIKDIIGREVWLQNTLGEHVSFPKNPKLLDIFQVCNPRLEMQDLDWLSNRVKITYIK